MRDKMERATYGTEIATEYLGTGADGDWRHHRWSVTLTREGQSITFPYRMGLAHEQTKCGKRKPSAVRYVVRTHAVCQHIGCERAGWQPTPPSLYDVLCSLKADSPLGQTFAEWCDDFGYDTDSRKAMDTYLACQESEDRSRRFFGVEWSAIVEDEDYL